LILAHAFGARYDLPVPLYLFVLGGALVVFVSFLFVVGREAEVTPGEPEPDTSYIAVNRAVPAVVGLVVWAGLVAAGMTGSQEVAENIVPTAFWLIIWIAVPISCGVVGDWTPWINPFAVLARLADREPTRRRVLNGPALAWPEWLGFWPAVLIFFLVAGGELIYNVWATRPAVTATALLAYAGISAAGGFFFGAEAWLRRGEMFSVLLSTWGRTGLLRFARPGRRGFFGGLDQGFEPTVSRMTFVILMLMSVTFDGLLATPAWKNLELQLPPRLSVGSSGYIAVAIAALAVLVGLAWAFFGGFSAAVRAAGRLQGGVVRSLADLVPSLIPISFGYLVSHNLDYLLVNGQLLIPLAGNPAGLNGWNLLPYPFNDSYEIHRQPLPPAAIWYIQLTLIVAVHVAAVFIAHRHLARAARDRLLARRAELPWIAAMVGYTMTSLVLLAQPIARGG